MIPTGRRASLTSGVVHGTARGSALPSPRIAKAAIAAIAATRYCGNMGTASLPVILVSCKRVVASAVLQCTRTNIATSGDSARRAVPELCSGRPPPNETALVRSWRRSSHRPKVVLVRRAWSWFATATTAPSSLREPECVSGPTVLVTVRQRVHSRGGSLSQQRAAARRTPTALAVLGASQLYRCPSHSLTGALSSAIASLWC